MGHYGALENNQLYTTVYLLPVSVTLICGAKQESHHVYVSASSVLAAALGAQQLQHAQGHQEYDYGVRCIEGVLECVHYPAMVTRLDVNLPPLLVQPVRVAGQV